MPIVGWYASQQTLLQTSMPDSLRGCVQGISNTTNSLLRLCGLGAAGAVADRVGILPLVFTVGGLYGLASLMAIQFLSPPRSEG